MRMSDIVAQYIENLLEKDNGYAELQRNELAGLLGCVPSQINYVITSRFTPEHGYIVESKRGGGGYIRITRISIDKNTAIMHIVNSIGDHIDSISAEIMLKNMAQRNLIDTLSARLMSAALSDRSFARVEPALRDTIRASVMKNMLLVLI